MADYLAGLAARALGVASVVRPRPTARFESPPFEERETPSAVAARDMPRGPAPARPRKSSQAGVEAAGRPARTAVQPVRVPTTLPSPIEAELESPAAGDEATPPALDAPRPAPAARAAARSANVDPPRVERDEAMVRPATRRAAQLPEPPFRTARPEPPPVRVTIGRIEVRAVAPPPTPPRPTPQRPAPLSLDEYLEARRSGRR
jgi:hypothetical protein